jgi:hypothetical protein
VWALDLLALTGRRRNEILTLKWPMVDWQHSLLNLPDTKTGQLRVPVSAHVLALLKHHPRANRQPAPAGYVLRTPKGTRLRSINRTWENIRAAAGIPEVRLHDLRHSFASDALMSGVPLAVVGEFLGHKESRTTQRYAHLANHVVRQALEVATDRIVAASTPIAALRRPASSRCATPSGRRSRRWWRHPRPLRRPAHGPPAHGRRDPLGPPHRRQVAGASPPSTGPASTSWRWYERWCGDGTWQAINAVFAL